VIGAGYEHSMSPDVALQVEAFAFGTYFLPWFDLGEDVKGAGGGVRVTGLAAGSRPGFYLTPYLGAAWVTGEERAVAAGAFAGWAFALSDKLDLRVGAGVQYLQAPELFSTGFIAIDAVVGYRL